MAISEIHLPDIIIYEKNSNHGDGEIQEKINKIIGTEIIYPYNIKAEPIGGLGENKGFKNIGEEIKEKEFIDSGLKDFEITYLLESNGKGMRFKTYKDIDKITMFDIDKIFNDLLYSNGIDSVGLGILRGNCEENLSFSNKIEFIQKYKKLYERKKINKILTQIFEQYKELNKLEEKKGIISEKYIQFKKQINEKYNDIHKLANRKDIKSISSFISIGNKILESIKEAKSLLYILKINRNSQIEKLNNLKDINIAKSENLSPVIIRNILEKIKKIKIDLIEIVSKSKLDFELKEKYIIYIEEHFQEKYSAFLKISTKIHDYKASKLDDTEFFETLNDLFNFRENFLIKLQLVLKEKNTKKNKKNIPIFKKNYLEPLNKIIKGL